MPAASRRNDANAASRSATSASSSSSPSAYDSRNVGVTAKAVPLTGHNAPSATSRCNMARVAGM
ncbi:Uncharacterised protein [Mycobacterium tuberculosis]|nr:Uncharacterised protein [Mycobacterium tuberculosis]